MKHGFESKWWATFNQWKELGGSVICTGNGAATYDAVRIAMGGEPYTMSLTGRDEIRAVTEAVNIGIDAHLEAC
jgi:hypothetical protein